MVIKKQDLLTTIIAGKLKEHYYTNVELKSNWLEEYGRKISALANKSSSNTCYLVIGIDDNGKLLDKSEKWAKRTEQTISQHINMNLDPSQACLGIECHKVEKSYIIIIEIEKPGTVAKWKKHAYKMSGTTIMEMTPEEIMESIVQSPGTKDYSRQPWKGAVNEASIQRFTDKLKSIGDEVHQHSNVLEQLNIAKKNVARILFGDVAARIVYYNEVGSIIQNLSIKPLYSILEDDFLDDIHIFYSHIGSLSLPIVSIREAISNAVAHAAYFEQNGDIIIELYDNQINVSNLCLPESSYFANKWFSRAHKSVNPLLMEILRLSNIVDELGRGKKLIFTESIKMGLKPPSVTITNAGRFNRWQIIIPIGHRNELQIKAYKRLKKYYKSEIKAQVAYTLVSLANKKGSEIVKYIDDDSKELVYSVLYDINGPIFYDKNSDKIHLNRWIKVLLEEGQESKKFDEDEESHLFQFAYTLQNKYHSGYITPKSLRKLAHMSESQSDKALSSRLLKKWLDADKISRVSHGKYRFVRNTSIDFAEIIKEAMKSTKNNIVN